MLEITQHFMLYSAVRIEPVEVADLTLPIPGGCQHVRSGTLKVRLRLCRSPMSEETTISVASLPSGCSGMVEFERVACPLGAGIYRYALEQS
jgi:hypothetical protein